jgi:hypothetical protein
MQQALIQPGGVSIQHQKSEPLDHAGGQWGVSDVNSIPGPMIFLHHVMINTQIKWGLVSNAL